MKPSLEWILRLSNKTKVQAEQKEDEVNAGTYATQVRCLDYARTHDRNRYIRDIKVELHSTAYKECAR
jgi:hypothetical protein